MFGFGKKKAPQGSWKKITTIFYMKLVGDEMKKMGVALEDGMRFVLTASGPGSWIKWVEKGKKKGRSPAQTAWATIDRMCKVLGAASPAKPWEVGAS